MLKAYLSAQASSLSAFLISKTHISGRKTAKCKSVWSSKCHFCYSFFNYFSLFRPHVNSKTAKVLTLILARNWSLSEHAASQPLSDFIASNLLWSKKLFSALPGCCPLRRTPFSNLVRMRTSSLVPKPITMVIGLGTRLVHTWSHAHWLAWSLPMVVGKAHGRHISKALRLVAYL